MLLAPARERRQAQSPRDDAVHMLEQEHLGEEILILRARLQLAHGFVADLEQLSPRDRVLVLLDPLQDELLVLLFQRARGTRRARRRVALGRGRAQHGSTCTVTALSSSSRLRRSST